MRRVVSVWFPTFSTDRLQRIGAAPAPAAPFVTSAHDTRRRIIAAANAAAQAVGVQAGMPLAAAQALVPGLTICEAQPEGDTAALSNLALWCLRYSPLVAPDPPGGIWIDVTGCTHLAGGEDALLTDLVARLKGAGFPARAAIAGTPGAAHAVARFGGQDRTIVPPDGVPTMLAPLPIEGLRLSPEVIDGLRRLGFDLIGDLVPAARAPLVKRFGSVIALRLAQALGEQFESIHPVKPLDVTQRRLMFVEPISTAEAFAAVLEKLVRFVCQRLERASLGARRLDLVFERVDTSVQVIRIGTAQPSRDPAHLARLLCERFEQVDPGAGVEAMHLIATTAEPLELAQLDALPQRAAPIDQNLAALLDRLVNRFGTDHVFRLDTVESDVPERAVRQVSALSRSSGLSWPITLPRPVRLLSPPQPVRVIASLPDHPPAAFTWRRRRHRVLRADGPERIAGEWWRREGERLAVRDYFAVEDEDGRRFWLFRRGDGQNAATGDLQWFLHGIF
jgi:protein ImuB